MVYAVALMVQDLTAFCLAAVTPEFFRDAYKFHKAVSENDPFIYPRTEEQVKTFIDDGSLFAAWSQGEIIGICYAALDEKEKIWEIGGLAVDPSVQGQGIGTILMAFALAHTIVYGQPFLNRQSIISHVHEENDKPRRIMDKIGFKYTKPVELEDHEAPPSMKRNAEGNVIGDEFEFTPEGLKSLAEWFIKQDFDKLNIEFKMDLANIDHVRTTLDELARELS